ncbi:MAG: hypothetical protein QM664_07565 [Flavihumibacter sp.]
MRFLKTIRLILTFYRSFVLATSLITACCVALFYEYGLKTFSALFWFKLLTLGLVFYFIRSYKAKEFYYYQNLGVSRALLWSSTLTADFILFIASLIVTYKIR